MRTYRNHSFRQVGLEFLNPGTGGTMAYTSVQNLRKMRAKNKGWNRKLAANLRRTVSWLTRKGPEEFSRNEIKELKLLRDMIGDRLYTNALTKVHGEFLANPAKFRIPSGRFRIELSKKDL